MQTQSGGTLTMILTFLSVGRGLCASLQEFHVWCSLDGLRILLIVVEDS